MNNPILGVDLGKSRTGLALSENGLIASPLTTLRHTSPHQSEIASQLLDMVRRHSIRTVVFGLPFHVDGSVSDQSAWCERLVTLFEELLRTSGLAVNIVATDEYHSTKDAAMAYPHVDKDAAAAAIILQHYIDDHA